jgi:predicted phosphoribosyltransferase
MAFYDRTEAGAKLGEALKTYAGRDPVVLALPRGGLPVAAEAAKALHAPLDIVLVRKIGVPWQPELAMGAIADGPSVVTVRNEGVIAMAAVTPGEFDRQRDLALAELDRRRTLYRHGRSHIDVAGKTAIVVDDGVATGATMRAALMAVRAGRPKAVVMAVPVASPDALDALAQDADAIVCLESHPHFPGVGAFYGVFDQLSDERVFAILDRFAPAKAAAPEAPRPGPPAPP